LITYGLFSAALACSVAQVRFQAFNNVGSAIGVANEAQRFLKTTYFSMTTLATVGYGDITPASDAGRVIAMLIMIQGFLLLGFVLSLLLSVTSSGNAEH
jgi:hypothetical protein